MADTPSTALPPIDLNTAAERIELLAQIYEATLPAEPAHVIAPLSKTPGWLPDLDAAATNTDLEHVFAVYVDAKKQDPALATVEGGGLDQIVNGKVAVNTQITAIFTKAEAVLAKAPMLHMAQAGFTDVTITADGQSYKVKGTYQGIAAEFYFFAGDEKLNFVQAVGEVKKFLDANVSKLSKSDTVLFSDLSDTYSFTVHKKVGMMAAGESYSTAADAQYEFPFGKLSSANYARLDDAYDKLTTQIILPQYLTANWGDFDYTLMPNNTIEAIAIRPEVAAADGVGNQSIVVDERVAIMTPDEIKQLKDENNRDVSGATKLKYYARLFDSDAPGFIIISEEDYMEMVESLGHYPTSFYKGKISIDDVIDQVLLKALNADYNDAESQGAMKNRVGIHGLGQFDSNIRALLLLNQIAASSPHADLQKAARKEIQEFSVLSVADLRKITSLLNSKKTDSLLALQTLETLAWVYYNSSDAAVKQEIKSLSETLNTNNDLNPPERPSLLGADFDQGNWNYCVHTFAKRIAENDPEASDE